MCFGCAEDVQVRGQKFWGVLGEFVKMVAC